MIEGIVYMCGTEEVIVPYIGNEDYFIVDEKNGIFSFYLKNYIKDNNCLACGEDCR